MKQLLFLNVFFLVAFFSCKKDNGNIAYSGDYGKSYLKWLSFKKTSGDSYNYKVVTSSWIGYSTETTITVKQGKVTARDYVAKRITGTNQPTIFKEWKEDESQIGTHTEGASPVTLDEIYEKAKTDWLLKRDNTTTYFETENNGMISSCGYVPNGCADDCFMGITITSITAI